RGPVADHRALHLVEHRVAVGGGGRRRHHRSPTPSGSGVISAPVAAGSLAAPRDLGLAGARLPTTRCRGPPTATTAVRAAAGPPPGNRSGPGAGADRSPSPAAAPATVADAGPSPTGRLPTIRSTCACGTASAAARSEEHTSELQSRENLVCRLLLEKKK